MAAIAMIIISLLLSHLLAIYFYVLLAAKIFLKTVDSRFFVYFHFAHRAAGFEKLKNHKITYFCPATSLGQ